MNEIVRGYDLAMGPVLHALPIKPEGWHGVDCQRNRGICIYTRESLITRIADMIGEGLLYFLDINDTRLIIDRAGNVWVNHEYLSPDQYLPKLISE